MKKLRITVEGKAYEVLVETLDSSAPVAAASVASATVSAPVVAPAAPAEISAPYVPRTRSKDDAKEFELQGELLASQPDLDDNLFVWR